MGNGTDDAMAAIGVRFGISAAAGAGIGEGAAAAAAAAGLAVAPPRRVTSFPLPPGLLPAGSGVGSFLDLPAQFGPPTGWYWDITALSAFGFTAGALGVSKNFPLITAAGNPYAVEPVGSFAQAGVIPYPQRGNPLLAPGDRLVFTVTAALTGAAQISGQVVQVPAERLDEYLS